MPPTKPSAAPLLVLGRDHEEYGRVAVIPVSANTSCAMSAGDDAKFARTTQKEHPNEDAILVHEDARHTVICVADAHFGRESSERLLQRLAAELSPVPQNQEQLDAVLRGIASSKSTDRYASETTLVICIVDRLFRQVFGVSFGDSSVVRSQRGEIPQRENVQTSTYVSLAAPPSLSPRRATPFAFSPSKGDLLLVFTDGVDECCYRDPDHSITPTILGEVIEKAHREPERVVRDLTRLALAGVGGNPGGQDNVALVATRV